MNVLKYFLHNESGATAVEYGIMVAILAMATIAGGKAVGDSLNNRFFSVGDAINHSGVAEGAGTSGD